MTNVPMTQKARRLFTDEQTTEAAHIMGQFGKVVSQVAKEMGLAENTLRKWIKQTSIDQPLDL